MLVHLVLHLLVIGRAHAFRSLPVRQFLQAALGVGTGLGAGGRIFDLTALKKHHNGQSTHIVRLNRKDLPGNLLNFLLVIGLLIRPHGLLQRVNLDDALWDIGRQKLPWPRLWRRDLWYLGR